MQSRIQQLISLSTLLAVSSVYGQDRMLEEVVVTATKRAENSQAIPIAINAIGADMIEKMDIRRTEDLVRLAPSLTSTIGDNKQNSGFRLRGIGTSAFSIGVEQSVAVIVDDVATVQQGQSISDLADIERIEVLRGPQSTLFGKSASAGAINVVTKGASEEFEGSIELSATDDDETRVSASISGPISDSLGFRLSGFWSDYDGNVENLSSNSMVNSQENQGVRGKLEWQVNDGIDVTIIAHASEDESTCCALTWASFDPAGRVFGFVPGDVIEGITPSSENYKFRSDDGPVDETENSGASIRANFAMGEHTLTSITAVNTWEYSNDGDVDFSNVDVFGFFTGGALSGGFFSQSAVETDFFSQELRLVSPSDDKFEYLVGLYYADAETDRSFLRNPGLPIIPSDWVANATTETLALFGQFTWRFTEATSVTAGLRWNDEEITVDFTDNLAATDPQRTGKGSDDEVLGNLSLQHFINEDTMVYARYAQGYKGQAYDIATGFTQNEADNPVAPETSDSISFGIKSTLFDGRLRLNATAFFAEYEDFQAQSSRIFPDGSVDLTLNNVGELETQGLELEGAALIGDNLTLTFGAAFIDAEIKSFLGANCFAGQTEAQGCIDDTQDIRGGALSNAPDSKFNIGIEYAQNFDSLPFDGFFLLSYVWQDEVQFDLTQHPRTIHDSYGVANLSFGINERANDRYRVTAFVNNLTDENYRSSLADLGALYGGVDAFAQTFSRNSERHVGVRLKFSF